MCEARRRKMSKTEETKEAGESREPIETWEARNQGRLGAIKVKKGPCNYVACCDANSQ